jgi:error-prone DNA polymerase
VGEGREGGKGLEYAELQVTSNFSFLRGASRPEELVLAAAALGHSAVAITDRNTVAGIVRAHVAAKEVGIRLVIGTRLEFQDGWSVLCFPRDRAAYSRMTTLLTLGKRRAPKGECHLTVADLDAYAEGQILVVLPPELPDERFAARLAAFRERHAPPGSNNNVYLAAQCLYRGNDRRRIAALGDLADRLGIGLVATNDVHYHAAERRPLQDVLTCIREGCTIHDAGRRLFANAERHLKLPSEMALLFRDRPDAISNTQAIVDACSFSLEEIKYDYPAEPVPEGSTPQQELERLTWLGAAEKFPNGIPDAIRRQIEKEFELVAQLNYAPYFLTVRDIVRFANEKGILCQGRGSAANSVICYVLGITAVDPTKIDLLFERFVSAERNEPPDIDVDFEHERREEVIQYIYGKYGRERAGIAATVISYRPRSALRDVGKALGLSLDAVDVLSRVAWSWERERGIEPHHLREVGLDPNDRTIRRTIALAGELMGFPRHLSQHVGGFVITRSPLHELVPIENAAMEDRTVIEWDKDDLDRAGLLKIDVLALGMLTCIRKGFELLKQVTGREHTLATVPPEDPQTYDMICRADTIGVFQIESRAQMSMLPRLQPRQFYDLVIEVAIVRPGPIQGDMVHPYLKRREEWRRTGQEPEYPSGELRSVLQKTFGVPLFQEQAMKIAIVAAGFKPAEADQLRRAMATFKNVGTIERFRDRFIGGMVANGYDRDFAQRCFQQIEGFGSYGFPESHAASFALLVYVSAWMKCRYPAVFAAALLNSQPMGFYAPAQIVRDAREHDVEVRPVDVNHSDWDCTLEIANHLPPPLRGARATSKSSSGAFAAHARAAPIFSRGRSPQDPGSGWGVDQTSASPGMSTVALRLGFRQIKGFSEKDARRLVEHRGHGYASVREVWRRAELNPSALETLANADAWRSLGLDRRAALWQIRGLGAAPLPLFAYAEAVVPLRPGIGHNAHPVGMAVELAGEPAVILPEMPLGAQIVEDYRHLRLTLKKHPLALLRPQMKGITLNRELAKLPDGARVTIAGLVLIRQQPGTAKGVIFATLEDETGVANAVVWQNVALAYRRALLDSRLLEISGKLQSHSGVIHVVAERLIDRTPELRRLSEEQGEPDAPEFQSGARGDDLNKSVRPDPRDPYAAFPEGRNFH